MKRAELAHILRAAATIVDDPDILVIGSQSILGSYWEDDLPPQAWMSMEADIAFLDDPDGAKADVVDGAIGELSTFHDMYSYYAQGVEVSTAVLPNGWRDRVVRFDSRSAEPAKAVCLDKHDLVISKLVAMREKDREFAMALLKEGLIDVDVLRERVELLTQPEPLVRRRVVDWIEAAARRLPEG